MSPHKDECRPLIVGIGASAGGLAAFKSFLANVPAEPNMAFILVQHLAPDHKSLLVELLAAKSPMPVITAADGVVVKTNCVYVIPPDATLTITNGILAIASPAPIRRHRRPIDVFFSSLAEDQGECAVGIVLSGIGSDGSVGIRAIKELGGLTIAQAEYDHHALSGMPSSATATGMVDHVMPAEAMGQRLILYQEHLSSVAKHTDGDGVRKDIRARLGEITSLLQTGVKHDFSGYKETTLIRRLQRRMLVLQIDSVAGYIDRLKSNSDESAVLFQEVLIGVTQFFRDPEAFDSLNALVIKPLVASKAADDPIRIWIVGCSTGEEVYSVAILLKEALSALSGVSIPVVKIFGTDIDPRAVSFARSGRYRKGAIGISPERLARWFITNDGDICPVPELREMCVFSVHSIVKDPPSSRIDLISCRNLLIYLDTELQSRVARTFHYALKAHGFLFLGTSESIDRHGNSFDILDKKNRVLQRNESTHRDLPDFQEVSSQVPLVPQIAPAAARNTSVDDKIDKSVRRVMEQYAPAFFVIDRNHEILRLEP